MFWNHPENYWNTGRWNLFFIFFPFLLVFEISSKNVELKSRLFKSMLNW